MQSKVLIGIPCMDSVRTKTAFSLFNLKRPEGTELMMKVGADVARNRNSIVEYALANDFTHILFIDSDMKFNPDTLEVMLANDVDICGVLYNQRALPLRANIMSLEEKEVKGRHEVVKCEIQKGLTEVRWAGTGIMLIKSKVFKNIKAPWFAFQYEGEYVGEDVYFCRKAREAGYKILIDAGVPVRHVGEFEY